MKSLATPESLTMDELRARPTVTVPEAGQVLNLGKNSSYAAAKRGDIPTIRIGGKLVVPTSRLLALLEGDQDA